jgi:concanavalin A-like lectin/glucanase superfamily protein
MPTPPSSGLAIWLKADSLALADGANVSAWTDSSGNSNTANWAFGTQPTFHTNQINGLPAVTVPNSQINFTNPIGPQTAVTTFAVIKLASTGSKGFLLGATLGGFAWWTASSGKLQGADSQNQSQLGTGTLAADTVWHQIGCRQQNNSAGWILEFRVDGAADATVGSSPANVGGNINNVGNNGYSTGNTFNGQVAEVLIYNRLLTPTEVTTVETYLNDRYVPAPPSVVVSPASAAQGASTTLTVTGTATHFVSGTTTVAFSGSGISVGTITVASATSLTVAVTISPTATTGARTMTVTTGGEAPTTSFTVTVGVFQRGNIDYDQVRQAARQGTGSKFQMMTGSVTTGHMAIYDASGNVVDGGAPSTVPAFVRETPSGTIDGSNTAFTLSFTPNPAASLTLYLNGVEQVPTTDYTISVATITYVVPPDSVDLMIAEYTH